MPNNSLEKTAYDRSTKTVGVPMSGTQSVEETKKKYDYDGTSHCKNCKRNEDKKICIANKKECIYYVKKRRTDGTYAGVCKKRDNAKQERERQQQNDIKNTQDISSYNGRRT